MNASVGDVLNQGKLAIYVSNISEEGILLQGNNLWVPTGGSSRLPTYENMARAMGIDLGGWSFGAQFGDLNNDGFLDLYLVNGYVSASRGESYWHDTRRSPAAISSSSKTPPTGRPWASQPAGYQPKRVWINDGSGGFSRSRRWSAPPIATTADRSRSRTSRDAERSTSRLRTREGPCCSTRTTSSDRQWIGFDLEGGCRSDSPSAPCTNRSAVGTQVELFWNGRRQLQEVSGGSGFCAQNQRTLHFGSAPTPRSIAR